MMQCAEVVEKIIDHHYARLKSEQLQAVSIVQSHVRRFLGNFLFDRGFVEIPPVILSPITDPLDNPTLDPRVSCYGSNYQLTKSMIFHKQFALLAHPKIFCFSPNLRFECVEKVETGKHLFEFTQLDLEIKGASREEVMDLEEKMFVSLIKYCKKEVAGELQMFGRELKVPKTPFLRVEYETAEKLAGEHFEDELSRDASEPFWIVDIPLEAREFYDREDSGKKGYLLDMDMIYPEGFGEASSGGEREYEFERIVERIKKKQQDMSNFSILLSMASKGLEPSAGFGIGIERLVRYICGFKRIDDVALFPKIPGRLCL
ncbi:MAG: asparagine synthetase A [Candidatus Methanofastidiosia archaeon]